MKKYVKSASFESGRRPITYREIYDAVIGRGDFYPTVNDKIVAIAQFCYSYGYGNNRFMSKEDALWLALELFEEMTGIFKDPSQDEFDDMVYDISG